MYTVHHIIIIMIFWSMLTFFPWARKCEYYFFGWWTKDRNKSKSRRFSSWRVSKKGRIFNLTRCCIIYCPQEHSILNTHWCIISRIHALVSIFMPLSWRICDICSVQLYHYYTLDSSSGQNIFSSLSHSFVRVTVSAI